MKFGDKWVELEWKIEHILLEDGNRWDYMREGKNCVQKRLSSLGI